MLLQFLVFIGLASRGQSGETSLCDEGAGWKLIWQDDFDGPELNLSAWTVPVGVNNSFGRQANVTVEDTYVQNGSLVLRSRQLSPGHWTTGAAITQHKVFWQYGRFCVKAKLPGAGAGKSQGMWPAHWMMPDNYQQHCGYNEIDILEMVNGDGTAYGTYWYWGPEDNCTGPPVRAGYGAVHVDAWDTQFHEYSVEWTPKSLTYFIDNVAYKSYTESDTLPVNPHFMMLNTAVGGSWPGAPNSNTVFPAYHIIDSIRVTQKLAGNL